MGLLEDIKKVSKDIKRGTKRDKLLAVRNEIELMISEKISLPIQIELLIRNNIIDNIDLKYYRNILKDDFNYGKDEKNQIVTVKKSVKQKPKKVETRRDKKTATEMLSKSIDLKF